MSRNEVCSNDPACDRLVVVEVEVNVLKQFKTDMENRMRSVERTIWKAVGALALIVFLSDAGFFAFLLTLIKH